MTREEREIIEAIKIMGYDRTDYPREKVSAVISMAIEALQGDMYCPNCGVRLVTENEYLEPTQTHGRLIDADALMKELSDIQPYNWTESEAEIQEEADYSLFKSLINSAPTVQADRPPKEIQLSDDTWAQIDEQSYEIGYTNGQHADRPQGEWATVNDILDVYICDQCGEIYQIQNIPMWHFCPNCGADMRGGK